MSEQISPKPVSLNASNAEPGEIEIDKIYLGNTYNNRRYLYIILLYYR